MEPTKQSPNPQRFSTYEESADGQGFYLPTGEYFAFDSYGGWYAQIYEGMMNTATTTITWVKLQSHLNHYKERTGALTPMFMCSKTTQNSKDTDDRTSNMAKAISRPDKLRVMAKVTEILMVTVKIEAIETIIEMMIGVMMMEIEEITEGAMTVDSKEAENRRVEDATMMTSMTLF